MPDDFQAQPPPVPPDLPPSVGRYDQVNIRKPDAAKVGLRGAAIGLACALALFAALPPFYIALARKPAAPLGPVTTPAADPSALLPLREKPLGELITDLSSKDGGERFFAAKALESKGPEAKGAIPVLTQALKDPESDVRVTAAIALWKISGQSKQSVPVLEATLADGSDYARSSSAHGLMEIGFAARSAVPACCLALKDKSREVRMWSAFALGKMGQSHIAVDPLSEALRDKDSSVREQPLIRWAKSAFKQPHRPCWNHYLTEHHSFAWMRLRLFFSSTGRTGKRFSFCKKPSRIPTITSAGERLKSSGKHTRTRRRCSLR